MNAYAQRRFQPQSKLALSDRFIPFIKGRKVYPEHLEISICHACDAHCDFCWYAGTHLKMGPDSLMDWEKIGRKLISDFRDIGGKAISWTGGGEPTLHPDFPKFLQIGRLCRLKMGLFTNAHRKPQYDPSYLEWIRVSGTDRKWPVENIKWLRERSKAIGMALNYTGDDDAVRTALAVGHETGVDYVQVRPALKLKGLVTEREPPQIEDPLLFITEYKFSDCSQPHSYSSCYGHNFQPFIWHSGRVTVCAYHPDAGSPYTLGELTVKPLMQILDEAPRSVPVIATCQVCCRAHECNKMVNSALAAEHAEFV